MSRQKLCFQIHVFIKQQKRCHLERQYLPYGMLTVKLEESGKAPWVQQLSTSSRRSGYEPHGHYMFG